MKIQQFPIDQPVPYSRNAKTHPAEQVQKIAAQIHSVGFLVPIVVDEEGVILSGHGRLLAAKSLGMKEVPVVVAEGLSEDQKTSWRIADNKVSESAWDEQLLAFDLQTLSNHGFDLASTGFDMPEAERLMKGLSGSELPPDRAPAEGAQEMGEEGFQNFDHTCPKCGFEFDDASSS